MSRVMIDCRDVPSESGCGLVIAGEREEVLRAAVAHAVDVHGHTEDEQLRMMIESGLRPDSTQVAAPGGFIQLIEFRTHRIEEFDEQVRRFPEEMGADSTVRWAINCTDRDNPGSYLQVVAFPDHASAMANSAHPVTRAFAERMGKICEGEASFRNLDVRLVITD
jgi:quinol monooxygenase YgiN/predicted small metal-binding protein